MIQKILNKLITIAIILLMIAWMVTYKSCTNYKSKYESVVISKENLMSKFDSVLNLPPDTILSDPEIIKEDTIVYRTRWKDHDNNSVIATQIYTDSIINDSIDLRLKIEANELYSIDYAYRPVYKYQEKIIENKVPYPVVVIKSIAVPQKGFFINAGLGYSDRFSAKVGIMFLSKTQSTYSYDLIRYDDVSIHMLSYGIRF